MGSRLIEDERVRRLNDSDVRAGRYTLYWMQQSQRAEFNHALEFAIQRANENRTPLVVGFGLTENYPEANLRHFQFMLQGLRGTESALRERGIPFVVQTGDPADIAISLSTDAAEVICDRGYLRHQREWRDRVARECGCRVWQVESDAIVPVERASEKREYAARTIRSKIQNASEEFLRDLETTAVDQRCSDVGIDGCDLSDIDAFLHGMRIDRAVPASDEWRGGTSQARKRLREFVEESLDAYSDRKSVVRPHVSRLSPYLHFGQISPIRVALEVQGSSASGESKEEFLEELLVRRELAINFVHYEPRYDELNCLPEWALETLERHEKDDRPHHYTAEELERSETHDEAWNASMTEMRERGYLHNHLRMYWGKKILEWTNTIGHAYRVTLALNNKYFLDGRDANSFVNVLWLFGLHDRPHQERAVFGKIRYMSAKGLHRKIDVNGYLRKVRETYPQTDG